MTASPPTPPTPPPPRPSIPIEAAGRSWIRQHALKLAASALITVGIISMLMKSDAKMWPAVGDLANTRWWCLPAYAVIVAVMNYYRAVRWRFLLRGIGDFPRSRILAVSWIGFAAILIMPFRLGELVRPVMLREQANDKRISLTATTSTVIAERIIDGLYLSLVLAIALLLVPMQSPLPDRVVGLPKAVTIESVRASGFVMLGIFVLAFSSILFFYFARGLATRMLHATIGRISEPLNAKIVTLFEKFSGGLAMFGSLRDLGGFLFESTLYWSANALGMWLLAWGTGVVHADGSPPHIGEACALMGMLGVAILIPGPPGLLGLFQAGIYAGMTMYFPPSVILREGTAFTFLLYATQFLWTLASSLYFLVADRKNLSAFKHGLVATS